MNFFHIWLMTVAVSYYMQIKNRLEVYKDVADAGYLLNSAKLEKINKAIDEEEEIDIISKILINYNIFIPFYNLVVAALREDNYYKHTKEYIDELKNAGVLEVMNDEEKEAYSKSKTGFSAIKIVKRKWEKLSKAHMVSFEEGSTIWFEYKDDFEQNIDNFSADSIIILYSEGELSKLSLDEQKKIVYDSHIAMAEAILNISDNPDAFIENNTKTEATSPKDFIELEIVSQEETSVNAQASEEELHDDKEIKHFSKVKKR